MPTTAPVMPKKSPALHTLDVMAQVPVWQPMKCAYSAPPAAPAAAPSAVLQ
jgi:hypothetical protein